MKRKIRLVLYMLLLGVMVAMVLTGCGEKKNPTSKAKQGIVRILSGVSFDNGYIQVAPVGASTGTGFGVGKTGADASVFVTNRHVVSDISNWRPYEYVYICVDGSEYTDESSMIRAKVVYVGETVDLAIIQTEKPIKGVKTLPLLPSEKMETGDTVYALGFPGMGERDVAKLDHTVDDITVTRGEISKFQVSMWELGDVKTIMHEAKVNHGNSGGPIINENGQVVGINTQIDWDAQYVDHRNYAIYSDYAMEALDELDLPYTKGKKGVSESEQMLLIAGAGIAAVVVLVAIIVLVKKNGQRNSRQEVQTQMISPQPVTSAQPVTSPSGVVRPADSYRVMAVNGPLQGKSWRLNGRLSIGREKNNAICFPADTKGVSRMHCCIEQIGPATIVVRDLNATYGTFVNGRRLNPGEAVRVSRNAEIGIGNGGIKLILR